MEMSPLTISTINPIITGFAPDPSIIRIDDTYFLVTSSFHLFPGLPIYASTDLISWKHIGKLILRCYFTHGVSAEIFDRKCDPAPWPA